jgi:uncharacterized repeat protein (TIGR03803 family)
MPQSAIRMLSIVFAGFVVAAAPASAATELVVYSFGSVANDGIFPAAGLIDVGGTLYGTTANTAGDAPRDGTVFSVTPSGVEKVVYSFGSAPHDGANPQAGLIEVGGKLYGTTYNGGSASGGTVFSVTPLGVEKAVYSFGSVAHDGANPEAALIDVGGTLYGTTRYGGRSTQCAGGCGTVFSVTRSGVEKVVYSFGSVANDAVNPQTGLIDVAGTLYGTTSTGGSAACGCGAVFSVTPSGVENVVYSFGSVANDGANPQAGLIVVDGTLYGTTVSGGSVSSTNCGGGGCGTVFSVTTAGAEKVVYSFGSVANDGTNPQAGLIRVGGKLYGTTIYGADTYGTVFSVTPSGDEKVIYSFHARKKGDTPIAGLIEVGGTLYGTTFYGGAARYCGDGCGTVFSVNP